VTLSILPLAIAAATPLLLAVLGELVVEKSGIFNIGLEGVMLIAALTAVLGATESGSLTIGFLCGIGGAALAVLLFGVAVIHLSTDQVIAGAGLNFIALGVTGVCYRAMSDSARLIAGVPSMGRWTVPLLGRLPVVGDLFFHFDPVAAATWTIVPATVALFLWSSRPGLRLRACGESPEAVIANGLSPVPYRWMALAMEAVLAGTAGGYLALALSSGFAENMVAGRGFIALAIVVFGRWSARGSIAGVALFGITVALQYQMQASLKGFPFHLLLALPYVLTLLILGVFAGASRAPESLGRTSASPE
jgi:ABC-type uncharacterized transport system permease subunit